VKRVSVVLPNYNGEELLRKNLPSLFCALNDFDYEILVVDDKSTDNSVKFLQQNYPQIVIIEHKENKGFSGACNSGIFSATKELTCIANTDVTFLPNYFKKIIPMITEGVFAAKGRITNVTAEGEFLNFDTTARSFLARGLWRFNKTPYEEQLEGFSAELGGRFCLLGCCFVADTEKLKKINGYDEIFSPFYWEDSDLPFRGIKAGYDLRYVPEAEVIHEANSTINRVTKIKNRRLISTRNKFIFTWRNLRGLRNWVNHLLLLILFLLIRWMKLDMHYYQGFLLALFRVATFKGIQRN